MCNFEQTRREGLSYLLFKGICLWGFATPLFSYKRLSDVAYIQGPKGEREELNLILLRNASRRHSGFVIEITFKCDSSPGEALAILASIKPILKQDQRLQDLSNL